MNKVNTNNDPKPMQKIKLDPPKQAEYTLSPLSLSLENRKTISDIHGSRFKEVEFTPTYYRYKYDWIEEHCYLYKKTIKNETLVILQLVSKYNSSGLSVLFSHGNQCTLGTLYPMLIDLCSQLKCNIISYDYSGFGLSEGKATEKHLYSDAEDIQTFIKDILMIKEKDLLLFGHSIGAAPTIHYSNLKNQTSVAGIVLLSPVLLGTEFTKEKKEKDFLNKYLNTDCPHLIIHGKLDDYVPYTFSENLSKQLPNVYVWFPKIGNHFNIYTDCRYKFYFKLKFFVSYIAKERLNRSELLEEFTIKCNGINSPKRLKTGLINFIDNYINESNRMGNTPLRPSQLTFVSENSNRQRTYTNQSGMTNGSIRQSRAFGFRNSVDIHYNNKNSSSKRISEFNFDDNSKDEIIDTNNFIISTSEEH